VKMNLFSELKSNRADDVQDSCPRNVVHVITTIERGGAENQLLILVKAQIALGLNVTVVPLKGSAGLEQEFKLSGSQIYDLRMHKWIIPQILALRKALPEDTHILHAHLPQAELICSFARRKKSIFLSTRHFGGQFYPGKNQLISRMLSRIASSQARAIIAISSAVETHLVKHSEIKNVDRIFKIYYGFDCNDFKKNILDSDDSEKERTTDRVVIGTIARLSSEKDYPTLFKAFKFLTESRPNITLKIAGIGPLEGELRALAKKMEIDQKIIWEGKITNIPHFLQEIDIFVLSSKFEGFGMVLIEAMCMRKRIVAAGNSAQLEVLGHQGAGSFFETGNYTSLASKILESWNSDPRDFVPRQDFQLMKFSVENLIFQTINLYKQVTKKHS
jgi:glycosyltransferase involved in cell wall biosynthesis